MKISIKKYVDDPSLTWEERYKRLEAHHTEESQWMFEELKKRDRVVREAIWLYRSGYDGPMMGPDIEAFFMACIDYDKGQ